MALPVPARPCLTLQVPACSFLVRPVPACPCSSLPALACPCLPLPVPACPCSSLPALACPCLWLQIPARSLPAPSCFTLTSLQASSLSAPSPPPLSPACSASLCLPPPLPPRLLSGRLSLCLQIYLHVSNTLPVCPPIMQLSLCSHVCLCIYPSSLMSIHVSIYPSIHPSSISPAILLSVALPLPLTSQEAGERLTTLVNPSYRLFPLLFIFFDFPRLCLPLPRHSGVKLCLGSRPLFGVRFQT